MEPDELAGCLIALLAEGVEGQFGVLRVARTRGDLSQQSESTQFCLLRAHVI